jgi:hypothetical protein
MSISNNWFGVKYGPNDFCGVCSHLAPVASTLSYAITLSFAPFLYISGPIYLTINTVTYVRCAWNCNPAKFDIIFSDTAAESHKFTVKHTVSTAHPHTATSTLILDTLPK